MYESEFTEFKNLQNQNLVQRLWGMNGLVQKTINTS